MKNFDSKRFPFPFHSVLVQQAGKVLQEEYYPPYEKDMPHRMFSITKSLTSMAIGVLIAEGKLSYDTKICDCFPEFTAGKTDIDLRLKEMTLYDMLTMRTCYSVTTYKKAPSKHWVGSFFETVPDHRPGFIFKYDTSSAHTMAALVKKISGKGVLDLMREVCFDDMGFSKEAHVLTDPFGCEIGGSGLVCTQADLLIIGRLLLALYNNTYEKDLPGLTGCADSLYDATFWKRYSEYIRDALSFHTATIHESKTTDEAQGYGCQFWMIRDGGIMLYGMGGQYIILYPSKELLILTTADTQSTQGGTQYILDEANSVAAAFPDTVAAPAAKTPASDKPYGSFKLMPNKAGFKSFTLTDRELKIEGPEHCFIFPYGINGCEKTVDPKYGQTIYTQAYPQKDGSLYLRAQILDDYCGAIHFVIRRKKEQACLYMRKVEESLYSEFNGFFDGDLNA